MSEWSTTQQCLLCNPQMEYIEVPTNANVPPQLGGIWITMNETGEKRLFKPREICYECFRYHLAVIEEPFMEELI
tara:strand:+ start:5545 stop:5769 length:225 start_codon:yes stop_codon:yes gene_type:complete